MATKKRDFFAFQKQHIFDSLAAEIVIKGGCLGVVLGLLVVVMVDFIVS